jgi:hypothetical protein
MTYNPILSKEDLQKIKAQKHAESLGYSRGSLFLRILAFLFSVAVIALLILGYLTRDNSPLLAREGPGYYIGLIGGLMMLFILVYPAAKYIGFLRRIANLRFIYRTHIVFGILGPSLILFHANFTVDSPNSVYAMIAMLAVVTSGIVGRLFHTQVRDVMTDHLYDYGQIREKLLQTTMSENSPVTLSEGNNIRLQQFETWIGNKKGFWAHLLSMPVLRIRARSLSHSIIDSIKLQLYAKTSPLDKRTKKKVYTYYKNVVQNYFYSIRKTANFIVYERLLSVWRVFHLPLFIVLIFTVLLHVIYKHMY